MDNEEYHPHSEHSQGETPVEAAPPPDATAVIEQVRELLFGDHRRATESSIKGLEDKFAALTATIEARFADFERRLHESKSENESGHVAQVEAIGAALTELGERIKGFVAKPSA